MGMKNLKDFNEFSINEYYSDFSYLGSQRETEIGRRLERVRDRIKQDIDYPSPGEKLHPSSNLDAPNWLAKQFLRGVFGLGAATADLFGKRRPKKSKEKIDPEKEFEGWREDLGPKTSEKDLENFAKKSEKVALRRFGKEWDYNNPKNPEQKKFADYIKKGEEEIAKRMKK